MSIITRKNMLRKRIKINPSRPKTEEEQSISINITCLPEERMKKAPPQISYYLWQTSQDTDDVSQPTSRSSWVRVKQSTTGATQALEERAQYWKKGRYKKVHVLFCFFFFSWMTILTALLRFLCINLDYACIILWLDQSFGLLDYENFNWTNSSFT